MAAQSRGSIADRGQRPISPLHRRFVVACFAAVPFGPAAAVQDYPARPVEIAVPYPAGGFNDIIARIVALRLDERGG